jgi:hypothetical protein
MNIEYGIKDWIVNNVNRIELTYFDVVGQQKLVVNDKEYTLKNGLQVVINKIKVIDIE